MQVHSASRRDFSSRLRSLAVALAALSIAACGPSAPPPAAGAAGAPPAAEVNVVTLEARDVPAQYRYTGQAAGSREVEVRARVAGILHARNFIEGARVKKGQSLYSIDRAPYEVALARAEAEAASAAARLAQAKRNAERVKPLAADRAVSQKEIDDAVSAAEIAAAEHAASRARAAEARLNLGYTRVESPIAGISGRSLRSEGTLVPGPEVLLTTVTQVDPIWVNFGIPEADQARIARDTEAGRLRLPEGGRFEVRVQTADGATYARTGRLAFSDVRVSAQTGTVDARAELPNPDGRLRPGQFLRVTLSGATRPGALLVPQRAVLEGPQGKFVYVVSTDNRAEARPVELGEWSGADWIITAGLKPGERVIVDGVMRIGPGAPVRVAQPKPAADGAAKDGAQVSTGAAKN